MIKFMKTHRAVYRNLKIEKYQMETLTFDYMMKKLGTYLKKVEPRVSFN